MKIAKTRFDYIFFIYIPFILIGVLLSYFFLDQMILVLNWFMPACLILALIVAGLPHASQKPLSQTNSIKPKRDYWLLKLCLLQFSLTLIFISFSQSLIHLLTSNSHLTAEPLLKNTFSFYQGGCWPWPFIVLVTYAVSCLGSTEKKPMLLRPAVKPVIRKYANNIIGVGIEMFLKQALLFASLSTIGILLIQITEIIGQALHLTSLFLFSFRTILIGIIFLITINGNNFIKKLTRTFWQKKFSDNVIILIFCASAFLLLIILNAIITFIAIHVPHGHIPAPHSALFSKTINPNYWLLLSFTWWIGIIPLLTKWLAEFSRERSLRTLILGSLLFPSLLGLSWQIIMHFAPELITFIIKQFMANQLIILIINGISLLLTAYLFRNPHTCGITSDANVYDLTQPSKLSFIRTLWQLCTFFIVAYLFTSLTFITILGVGVTTPVFATLFSSILGWLITAIFYP